MTDRRKRQIVPEEYDQRRERLVELIADVKEKQALAEIAKMLSSGWRPADVMESCILAMREVGKRYEAGRYFIAALIMSGEIMRQITEILEPYLPRLKSDLVSGTILLGTISGDIHDLGKNLFAILARCEGFQVVDLGVDVEPERFLEEARKTKPDLIGISCVLTLVLPELKNAVKLLHREFQHGECPVMIGGNAVDEHIFNHVKADYWAADAALGVQACHKIMNDKKNAQTA